MPGSDEHPHVFLHANWRSGSTYFWSLFRDQPSVTAFAEPFHEALATLDETAIARGTWDSWPSGHPHLAEPYFVEYRPLLTDCGVAGFETRFGYAEYFDVDLSVGARRYVDLLLESAVERGTRAVLGFTRSLGRLDAFQRTYPDALHIVQRRSVQRQYASFRHQVDELSNPYFMAVQYALLLLSKDEGPLASVRQALAVQTGTPTTFDQAYATAASLVAEGDLLRDASAFLHVQAWCCLQEVRYAHHVVNLDDLADDSGARDAATSVLHQAGLELDLAELASRPHEQQRELARADVAGVLEWLGQVSAATADERRAVAQILGS